MATYTEEQKFFRLGVKDCKYRHVSLSDTLKAAEREDLRKAYTDGWNHMARQLGKK